MKCQFVNLSGEVSRLQIQHSFTYCLSNPGHMYPLTTQNVRGNEAMEKQIFQEQD